MSEHSPKIVDLTAIGSVNRMADERSKAWRHIDADLFQFATTDLHELRSAIMLVFDEASTLQPSLGFDDVASGLRAQGWDDPSDDSRLFASLKALVDWGLLDATQDHSARYSTPEEFERRNMQWSLTPRGQAAVAGFLRAFDVLRSSVSLQPAVLDAMADTLADLLRLCQEPGNESRITTRLAEVEQHHEALVANVRQFNGQLQRLLRDDAVSDDVFLDVKRRTISYLKDYVRDVERPARRLARGVASLEEAGVDRLHQLALVGANLAPVAGRDPGEDWIEERRRRWQGLRAWFAPPRQDAPRIQMLRRIADNAILQLLRVLDRRWEARRRSASIERDFRALAGWFGQADSEVTAHRLFNAAFGLWPSRHADLVEEDRTTTRDTPWCESRPVAVAPALRASGSQAIRGRARAIPDPSKLRAERQRRQADELARNAALRKQLITHGRTSLSRFRSLPTGPFAELLDLLGTALSSPPRSDGSRRATTTDAQVEIVLTAPLPGSPLAQLETQAGVLTSPDYVVQIRVLDRDVLASQVEEFVA